MFCIECIEECLDNNLKVFNKYDPQIYDSINYQNRWDGKPNMGIPSTSEPLQIGTYFYILDLNTEKKPMVGWLYFNY